MKIMTETEKWWLNRNEGEEKVKVKGKNYKDMKNQH